MQNGIHSVDVSLFLDKPCKFRLRSGKEVYGVIWREHSAGVSQLLFASSGDYLRIKESPASTTEQELASIAVRLNRDDVIAAEILDNL